MRTWYASPYRRIARRPHYIARNAGSEDVTEHENVLPVDVKSDGDAFMISAIVPGIEADDIDVEILNKTVSIRGKFNERVEDEDGKVLVSELDQPSLFDLIKIFIDVEILRLISQ
jgi:HSP20 family molecular chaperone IbpA